MLKEYIIEGVGDDIFWLLLIVGVLEVEIKFEIGIVFVLLVVVGVGGVFFFIGVLDMFREINKR